MIRGQFIPVGERVGFLDWKLRVINENTSDEETWSEGAQRVYQNSLGNEWQGDSLFLARENLLYTFVDFYKDRFRKEPPVEWVSIIADIISWNIMQMDGVKLVMPCSCHDIVTTNLKTMYCNKK